MAGYKLYLQEGREVHEGLKCSHCRLVLKDPIQTSQTGQRYCKECFEDARWFDYAMCELVLFYWPYFNRSSTSELAQLMIDCNDMVSDSCCGAWECILQSSVMLAYHSFKSASYLSKPCCPDKRLTFIDTYWKHLTQFEVLVDQSCLFVQTARQHNYTHVYRL